MQAHTHRWEFDLVSAGVLAGTGSFPCKTDAEKLDDKHTTVVNLRDIPQRTVEVLSRPTSTDPPQINPR